MLGSIGTKSSSEAEGIVAIAPVGMIDNSVGAIGD